MKPVLHVTLNVDAVKNEGKLKSASGNTHMRKVLCSRHFDFFKAHSEGCKLKLISCTCMVTYLLSKT